MWSSDRKSASVRSLAGCGKIGHAIDFGWRSAAMTALF